MARQIINIGLNDNDGTGDKLRPAMRKVNENFEELYAQTAVNTGISFGNGTISTPVVNGNLTVDPNGTGKFVVTKGAVFNTSEEPSSLVTFLDTEGDAYITVNPQYKNLGVNATGEDIGITVGGSLTVTSLSSSDSVNLNANIFLGNQSSNNTINFNGEVNTDILPHVGSTFDLGATGNRFKSLYTQTVYSNAATIANATVSSLNVTSSTTTGDSIMGNLVIRDNEISNNVLNQNIEINPYGTGHVFVNTKMIIGSGATPMVNPVLQATGNADNFTQIGVQNTSSGKFACSDIVIFNDQGSDFFNFVDIGQNNTGWDGTLQYIYFDNTGDVTDWEFGDDIRQFQPVTGLVLARGIIDEIVVNPANSDELRVRVSKVYLGETGVFEQGSTAGDVTNSTKTTTATPKDHVLETITSTGAATYNLGTSGTLNASTALAAFGPTVSMAADSLVVKVGGTLQVPGVDYTVQFNKIKFYNIPTTGATITIRQLPEANYPFTIGQSGDSYVYNNGSNLTIGTMTGHDVVFHTNGIRYTAEAGRIKGDTKNWIIGSGVNNTDGLSDSGDTFQVKGGFRVTDYAVLGSTESEPASSVGSAGDFDGKVVVGKNYLYRCVGSYDGTTNIWKRVALTGGAW